MLRGNVLEELSQMAQSPALTLRAFGFDLAALCRQRKVSLEDRVFAPLTERGFAPVPFVGKFPFLNGFQRRNDLRV